MGLRLSCQRFDRDFGRPRRIHRESRLPERQSTAPARARRAGRARAMKDTVDAGLLNAMTIDVEDYFHVSALAETISRNDWATMEYRAERKHRAAARDVRRSTTSRRRSSCSAGSRSARRNSCGASTPPGHEIACHGLTHELVYRQTPEVFRAETRGIQGHARETDRRAGARLSRGQLLDHRRIALGARHPLRARLHVRLEHLSDRARPLRHSGRLDATGPDPHAERPRDRRVPAVDRRGARRCACRCRAAATSGCCRTGSRAGRCARVNEATAMPFVFYLHPWEIDPDQPRVRASRLSRFRHYNNLDVCERGCGRCCAISASRRCASCCARTSKRA